MPFKCVRGLTKTSQDCKWTKITFNSEFSSNSGKKCHFRSVSLSFFVFTIGIVFTTFIMVSFLSSASLQFASSLLLSFYANEVLSSQNVDADMWLDVYIQILYFSCVLCLLSTKIHHLRNSYRVFFTYPPHL